MLYWGKWLRTSHYQTSSCIPLFFAKLHLLAGSLSPSIVVCKKTTYVFHSRLADAAQNPPFPAGERPPSPVFQHFRAQKERTQKIRAPILGHVAKRVFSCSEIRRIPKFWHPPTGVLKWSCSAQDPLTGHKKQSGVKRHKTPVGGMCMQKSGN